MRLPIDSPAWAAFIGTRPESLPFHHPAWASTISRTYGFPAFVLARVGADGVPSAGVPLIEVRRPFGPRRWVSLPFTDVCPPLVDPDDEESLAQALDAARIDAGVDSIELTGRLAGCASDGTDRVVHVLALDPDPATVERGWSPTARRNVRAARNHQLSVRVGDHEQDLVEVFYRLQVLRRRHLGLPPQPRRFFVNLWRDVLEAGLGRLLVVEHRGSPAAAAVLLRWNGTVIYKYGASDPATWQLRPNNLLFASAIEQACLAGDRIFHFGRSDRGDGGLRRFKAGWGAVEAPLETAVLGRARGHSEPPAALRAVIRRSPSFVARGIGAALYRYAA